MSDFEFIFALFGLLLGLSLAEVLAGVARTVDARLRPGSAVRIGWLTPLLAAFVLLDLLSFWHAAWVSRALVAVSGRTMVAVMVFAGLYYLAASLVFPRDAADEPDFDKHFLRVRRFVIGAMLVLLVCQIGWYLSVPELAARLMRPLTLGMTVTLFGMMVGAMVARGKGWSRLAMAVLVARYMVLYLI